MGKLQIAGIVLLATFNFIQSAAYINLFNAIDNNPDRDQTTKDDLNARGGFFWKGFSVTVIVLVVLMIIGFAVLAYFEYRTGGSISKSYAKSKATRKMTSLSSSSRNLLSDLSGQ